MTSRKETIPFLGILQTKKRWVLVFLLLALFTSIIGGSTLSFTPASARVSDTVGIDYLANNPSNCITAGGTYTNGSSGTGYSTPPKCDIGDGTAQSFSYDNQVRSILYYKAIISCFQQNAFKSTMLRTDLADNKWFDGGDVTVGLYLREQYDTGDDGKVGCSSDGMKDLIGDALSLWGIRGDEWFCAAGWSTAGLAERQASTNQQGQLNIIKSNVTAANDRCTNAQLAGYDSDALHFYVKRTPTETNPSQYEVVNGALNEEARLVAEAMGEVVSQRLYGAIRDPALSAPVLQYQFYRKVFFNSCAYDKDWRTDGLEDIPASSRDSNDTTLRIVFDDGTEKSLWFRYNTGGDSAAGTFSSSTPVKTLPDSFANNFAEQSMNCGAIRSEINTLYTDYQEAVLSAIEDGEDRTGEENCEHDEEGCIANNSCSIPGIGWMICPVFNFIAEITDGIYKIIEGLLVTQIGIFDTSSGTYNAWVAMRNIANIGFVIVFLIIIFSQISNVGVTNYGVKKLLPRLLIAAILVNLSFIVCQLAVDISNIVGSSLKSFLDSLNIFPEARTLLDESNWILDLTTDILAGQLIAGTVAAGLVVTALTGVGLLIPVLLGALLALVVMYFILIARQALIILLIVVSPLAFLAMLLPNTENYFKQWRKVFVAMLILYPAVALLFGGSKLASGVLLNGLGTDLFGKLAALAVLFIPLFALPTIIKGSLNAIPAIGNIASKLQARANGLVGSKAKEFGKATPIARGMAIRKQARENYRTKKFAKAVGKGGVTSLLAGGVPLGKLPGLKQLNKKFGTDVGGASREAHDALERQALRMTDQADTEDVKAAQDEMVLKQLTHEQLAAEMTKATIAGDTVRSRAAQNILLQSEGGRGHFHSAMDNMAASGMQQSQYQHLQTNIQASYPNIKEKDVVLDAFKNGGTWGQHKAGAGTLAQKLDDAKLAGQPLMNVKDAQISYERAQRMLSNDNLGYMSEDVRAFLKTIAPGAPGPTSPSGGEPSSSGNDNNGNPPPLF